MKGERTEKKRERKRRIEKKQSRTQRREEDGPSLEPPRHRWPSLTAEASRGKPSAPFSFAFIFSLAMQRRAQCTSLQARRSWLLCSCTVTSWCGLGSNQLMWARLSPTHGSWVESGPAQQWWAESGLVKKCMFKILRFPRVYCFTLFCLISICFFFHLKKIRIQY